MTLTMTLLFQTVKYQPPVQYPQVHPNKFAGFTERLGRKLTEIEKTLAQGTSTAQPRVDQPEDWWIMDQAHSIHRRVPSIGRLTAPPPRVFTAPGEPPAFPPPRRRGRGLDVGDVFLMDV
jgi:hypothetical protein